MKKSKISINNIPEEILPNIAIFLSSHDRLNLMMVQKKYVKVLETPYDVIKACMDIIFYFKSFDHPIKDYNFVKQNIKSKYNFVAMYILAAINIKYQTRYAYCSNSWTCKCFDCTFIKEVNSKSSYRWLASTLYWDKGLNIQDVQKIKLTKLLK